MTHGDEEEPVRIDFDVAVPDTWLQRVRTTLREPGTAPVVIDMTHVTYTGPAALGALKIAAADAAAAGRELWLDHVPAPVYKTLQLAKLAPLFQRVHHGTS